MKRTYVGTYDMGAAGIAEHMGPLREIMLSPDWPHTLLKLIGTWLDMLASIRNTSLECRPEEHKPHSNFHFP